MKRTVTLILVAVIAAALGAGIAWWMQQREHAHEVVEIQPAGPPTVAPAFTLSDLDGKQRSFDEWKGRTVVLNFWATWCAPCLEEHETLQRTAAALGRDVQFLGVVYEDEEDRVKAFQQRYGATYPSLLDPEGKAAIAYGVAGVPETYFIDAAGVIQAKYAYPLNAETMAENLRKIGR